MASDASKRILAELDAHPRDRDGFNRADFAKLDEADAKIVAERLFRFLDQGAGFVVPPLEWLFGERYVGELKARLARLLPGEPGLVFLPYWIYDATGEREYLGIMMREIVYADPAWSRRNNAVDGYLQQVIGKEPIFHDFCRYLVINDPSPSMKETAIISLAEETGYPVPSYTIPEELARCVAGMNDPEGPSTEAMQILNQLHPDTHSFRLI